LLAVNTDRLRKAPNIAIVGSSSPVGKELREMIEAPAFPAGRLTLLETEEYAGLLQEFAGEIQITQILSPQAFADIDIAFFACSPEIINAYAASGAAFPDLTIDLTQTGRAGTLYLGGVSQPSLLKPFGYYINPHPAVIALGRVLSRIRNACPVEAASITILEPASERGAAGVTELQEQTVSLLNFQPVEHTVFGGQLAFNLLPEIATARRVEDLVRSQLAELLGGGFPPTGIAIIQVPVFHSHGFSIFLRLSGSPSAAQIRTALEGGSKSVLLHAEDGLAPSPVTIVGSDAIHIARIETGASNSGSCFLWAVADNLRLAASNALQIAESLMFAPASPR
jgi:aspartate-semialdehyde dehydrogenase